MRKVGYSNKKWAQESRTNSFQNTTILSKIEISETLYPKKKKDVFRVDWSHNKKIKLFENILPDK